MRLRLFAPMSLLLCIQVCAQSSAPSAQHSSSPPHGKEASGSLVKHAEWRASIESFLGISQKEFADAGLAKLTADEFSALLLAIYDARQEALSQARSGG